MIPVTKTEKFAILKKFPNAQFTRTMKQDSKRGHYYCVEQKDIMKYLKEIRRANVVEFHAAKKEKR